MEYTGERLILAHKNCAKNSAIYKEHIARYNFTAPYIKNKKVLDIACGSGYGSNLMIANGASEVWAGDIDAAVIKTARAKYQAENLHFQVLDVINLPFPDNSFTAVVSFETIEHLKNQVRFMAEIKRVLQPAGKLIISTPDKEMTDYLGINNPFHVKELNRTEFTVLLSNNFKNIKLFGQRPVKRLNLTQKLIQKLYFIYRKFKWLEFLKSLFSENIKAGISKDISGLSADFSVREIKANQDYLYYIIIAEK